MHGIPRVEDISGMFREAISPIANDLRLPNAQRCRRHLLCYYVQMYLCDEREQDCWHARHPGMCHCIYRPISSGHAIFPPSGRVVHILSDMDTVHLLIDTQHAQCAVAIVSPNYVLVHFL